jgi:hypothetical protein
MTSGTIEYRGPEEGAVVETGTITGFSEQSAVLGVELDGERMVWGDARMTRNALDGAGVGIGDRIDYDADDAGVLLSLDAAKNED